MQDLYVLAGPLIDKKGSFHICSARSYFPATKVDKKYRTEIYKRSKLFHGSMDQQRPEFKGVGFRYKQGLIALEDVPEVSFFDI